MTLPVAFNPISLRQVNVELYRAAGARITLNDFDVRKLASTGNTGQSLTSGTLISMSTLFGHARYNRNINTWIQNPNIVNDAAGSGRYASGLTWLSYNVLNGGAIGSTSTATPSLIIPTLPSGDIMDLIVNVGGYIVGAGGVGGRGEGGGSNPPRSPGLPGGTGLQLNAPTTLTNSGVIGGGGGGGGGGNNQTGDSGGGGGGGAGFNSIVAGPAIQGGLGGPGPNAPDGRPGTLTTGGAGGNGQGPAGNGGNGGALGAGGGTGGDNGAPGGGGGVSISGTRFIIGGSVLGDVRGVQVF